MMPVSDAAPVWAKALTGIRRAMQRSRSAFDSTSRGVLMVPPSIWRNHGAAGVASQVRRELEVLAARGESLASHRDGRGAPPARRDDREYREYLSEEQRSRPGAPTARTVRRGVERGCIARRMQPDFHHGLLDA